MAHLLPFLSYGCVLPAFAKRDALRRLLMRCLICAISFSAMSVGFLLATSRPGIADAWLDRVERNLRRIEAVSKYKEPLGAGSPAAEKVHRKCIHKADIKACEQIIWRRPELLPIRDWAVGTAHVKRGELREKDGDVQGAIDDYRDALGYHQFPSLQARIKRLSLRLQRQQDKKSVERRAMPPASHPVVVVEGWTPTSDRKTETSADRADGEDAKQVQDAKPESSNVTAESVEGLAATGAKLAQVDAPLPLTDTASGVDVKSEITQVPKPTLVTRSGEAAPQDLAQGQQPAAHSDNPTDRTGVRSASRFTPGARVAVPPTVQATRPVPQPNVQIASSSEAQTAQSGLPQVTPSQTITTSALADRGVEQDARAQGAFHWWAMVTLAAMVLCSTLILMIRNRDSWPAFLVRPKPQKHVLSVEELELLVKQRAAQTRLTGAEKQTVPYPRPTPSVSPTSDRCVERQVSRIESSNMFLDGMQEAAPTLAAQPLMADVDVVDTTEDAMVAATPGTSDERLSCDGDGGLIATAQSVPASAPIVSDSVALPAKYNRSGLDSSLLRRVSYGAAGLIIAGSETLLQSTIEEKVDDARRPELVKALMRWDISEPRAAGVLNAFSAPSMASDPLVARQRFNAAFEFYAAIFETIFGLRFVQQQKVMLRHMAMLLHAMPDPSLHVLYESLQNRRTLEPLHDALSEIDCVQTRLFFTTTFASDEFDARANFMRDRLAEVLSNDRVLHLCGASRSTHPLVDVGEVGRLIFLPLDGAMMTPTSVAVLLRSLVAVLRMQSFSADQSLSDRGVSVFLHSPNLEQHLGGSPADTDFFVSQLDQSGYVVV